MINIRANTFETNSSSVHSMCITEQDIYQQWVNGELYYNVQASWNDFPEFVSYEEAQEYDEHFPYPESDSWENWAFKDPNDGYLHDKIFITFKEFFDNWNYNFYNEEYITDNGDCIQVFGYYGQD